MSRESIYWLCQLGGWTAFAAVGVVAMSTANVPPGVLGAYTLSGVAAVGVSHAYRLYIRRQGWMQLPLHARLMRLIAGSVVSGVAATAAATLVYALFGFRFETAGAVITAVLTWIFSMLYWSTAYGAVHVYEDYRRAQRQQLELDLVARESQLRALIAQVNPHFLFNSLNSVRSLIDEDPAKARDTVTHLAHLLRYSLRSSESHTIRLEEELEAVRNYLDCESVRFEDRMSIEWDVQAAALQWPVPPMLIQTLVENAVKHGVGINPGAGFVNVSAAVSGPALRVQIANSGSLNARSTGGTGISNARARLKLLYDGRATLTLTEESPNRVVASLGIP